MYATAKAGLNHYTKCLAQQMRGAGRGRPGVHGVRPNPLGLFLRTIPPLSLIYSLYGVF
jgi:NAD(P)-dependent dehydrogenase (short-subunit alcohol dehydrogenase family)